MSDNDDLFDEYMSSSEPIDARQRRELVRNILPELINRGYTQNQALQEFRSRELGIKYQEFNRIYAEITGYEKEKPGYLSVRRNYIPSDSAFQEATYNWSKRKYRIDVEFEELDEQSGEVQYSIRSYYFDNKRTRAEIEGEILSDRKDSLSNFGFQVSSMKIIGAYKSRIKK